MNRFHDESLSVECTLVRIGLLFGMQVAFSIVEKTNGNENHVQLPLQSFVKRGKNPENHFLACFICPAMVMVLRKDEDERTRRRGGKGRKMKKRQNNKQQAG